jgi:hypothetical protein
MDEVPSHSASGPLLPLLPGCFKMDQDSYSKLMASSYERHLKRTKNLLTFENQHFPNDTFRNVESTLVLAKGKHLEALSSQIMIFFNLCRQYSSSQLAT